ncbi:trypsin-like peptidase domain-containing protein [Kitasatospora purpeofusca]|uniref:nSTAND1 domain-containing NTPase n=1 Tax=Kitasatospora purpeofusca TaxID=67352 RepID=UPI003679C2CE
MAVGRGTWAGAGAADGLAAAVAQVRDEAGLVVGAGFLVANDLLVTCAHVLEDGRYGPGSTVTLAFPRAYGAPEVAGRVLAGSWRESDEQDVALVRLDRPVEIEPLQLGSAVGARGHRVCSFGFPVQAPPGGHFGYGTAGGILPDDGKVGELLQLAGANDLTQGFSGGPVLDEVTGLVVGMLTSIAHHDSHNRGQEIAYATPTSVLRRVRSALNEPGELDELDVSPYRALEPFTAEHARWFRGREDAVRQVLAGLDGGRRVVLLLGPSGSGKSSLVQAGVLPALAAGRLAGSDRWRQVLTRPGPDLPGALARAGLPGSEAGDAGADATDGAVREVGEARVVLVVDQFEEFLAPAAGPEALRALARLTTAIRSDAPLSVVLVMRDDFYSRLSALAPDLLDTALKKSGVLNVPATLSAAELDAIVTGPALDLDTPFEPGLAEQIIADVLKLSPRTDSAGGAPVTVLPLLEVALTRLWERRLESDGRLTHHTYQHIGAVTGALTDWCGTALRKLDSPQRDTARRILTALVRPAVDSLNIPAARQQLPISELRDLAADDDTPGARQAVDEVLAVLSRHRIVTTHRLHDHAPLDGKQGTEGTEVAELVHDALIRDWVTLREWVEEDLRFLGWFRRARDQYDRWKEHRDPRDLPTGTLLAEGTDWSRQRRRLTADLDNFLKAGRRRGRRLNTILATVLALALIAAGVAFWQRQTAVTAQQIAQSRQLAALSDSLRDVDPELAGILAISAYRTSPTDEAAASLSSVANRPLPHRPYRSTDVASVAFSSDGSTLAAAVNGNSVREWDAKTGNRLGIFLTAHGSMLPAVFSPNGNTLATADDEEGVVSLWDVRTGHLRTAPFTGHTGTVTLMAFSPDRHALATTTGDGTVRVWDAKAGNLLKTFPTGLTGPVRSMALGPDGNTLATVSDGDGDGTVRVWDAKAGNLLKTFPAGLTGPVRAVAFSPDGNTLATGGDNGTVLLRDATTGNPRTAPLTGHTGTVTLVAFSPDGHALATAADDDNGTVRVWEAATGKPLTAPFTGHTRSVRSVAFSPDGHTLATVDGDLRLWDMTTDRPLTGHTGTVRLVAFSPDGNTLASKGDDGTVLLRNAETGDPLNAFATGHTADTASVSAMALSPDGHALATAGSSDNVSMWDPKTGDLLSTFATGTRDPGDTASVSAMAFSPDGHALATAGPGSGDVRVWNPNTGDLLRILSDVNTRAVTSLAFSPDGQTLATAHVDGTVRVWDVRKATVDKPLTTFPTGHSGTVRSVVFSPDGHTLATVRNDNTVREWDAKAGKPLNTFLTSHTGDVLSAAFSGDGKALATVGRDGTVRVRPHVPLDAAVNVICTVVSRRLTKEEVRQYFPGQEVRDLCPPENGKAPESLESEGSPIIDGHQPPSEE